MGKCPTSYYIIWLFHEYLYSQAQTWPQLGEELTFYCVIAIASMDISSYYMSDIDWIINSQSESPVGIVGTAMKSYLAWFSQDNDTHILLDH